MSDGRMPAVFFGHGNPMNTLEHNRYTEAWQTFGATTALPRAILAVSAHWYVDATMVTAMAQPRTIHDFYGFPDELFAVQYPAPGDPALAGEVAELVSESGVARVGLDQDLGLDHGTWSVLVHAYPQADIPVVQLSIDSRQPIEFHLRLGAALAPLRDRGVLIVCSGNVVHNLGLIRWDRPGAAVDWAREFNEQAVALMKSAPAQVAGLVDHRNYALAAPTPDHFIPLLYLAGLADAADTTADVLIDGYDLGSLSMTSFAVQ